MSDPKIITQQELEKHVTSDDFYLLIGGKVYDLSKFMDEHPGGDDVLLAEAGKDATDAFDDVGHSQDAQDMLEDMLVGTFGTAPKVEAVPLVAASSKPAPPLATSPVPTTAMGSILYFTPLVVLGLYLGYRYVVAN